MHFVHAQAHKVGSKEGFELEMPYEIEEFQYMGGSKGYLFKQNTKLPTHYNPNLRTHENISMLIKGIITMILNSHVSTVTKRMAHVVFRTKVKGA